ncbi:histidine utilization repressor [Flocculibacter collagenilyticus]|uniref:histidine utilization repressor n=1 Tax=Flocculibacter collagenilyticus TaxID=2744479 RepID=UPI0018F78335|nr:histidine utilization repressor [Flocculibacter collagenilyticus]
MAQPKFITIKQYITKQIESGEWPENSRVPSENALSSMFNVSRMTARRALQELTEQSILTRTQGLGTFVANIKSQSSLLEIRNIADEIRERGHSYSCHQIKLESTKADSTTAIALGIDENTTVFHSILIHQENSIPIQMEERFINPKFAPDYLAQDYQVITPHEYLCEVAPLTEANHTVEAINPNSQQQAWLALDAPEPCLQVSRRTWSRAGIVSYARLISPGTRYRLGTHLKIQ